MPLYEYECTGCHKVIELIQKFSDTPLSNCPECGKPVNKLMSKTTFQLKGTGWHNSDYKKKPAPTAASSGGGSEGSTSTSNAGSGSGDKA